MYSLSIMLKQVLTEHFSNKDVVLEILKYDTHYQLMKELRFISSQPFGFFYYSHKTYVNDKSNRFLIHLRRLYSTQKYLIGHLQKLIGLETDECLPVLKSTKEALQSYNHQIRIIMVD